MRRPFIAFAGLSTALSVFVGRLAVSSPGVALGLALAPVFIAVNLAAGGLVSAATVPAVFFTYRVGPTSANVSLSDLTLLCAIPLALLTLDSAKRPLAAMLRLIGTYELVLLVVVAAHPSSQAITEWVHRLGLLGGGVLVGAAIVRLDAMRIALRLFLATASVYAVAAVIFTVRHGFAVAYPLGIHKNAAGGLLAMAIGMVATMPVHDVIPARYYRPLYVLFGAGLAATRSRGAMLGVAVALGVYIFTRREAHRFRVIVALSAVAGLVFVWTSVRDEQRTDIYKTGSLSVRSRQQAEASAVFRAHRLLGAGIRYYDENPALALDGRPSSTAHEVTAESGVVGAADLILLVSGVFVIFRRERSPYATTALTVFGVKAIHAVFDNFWVAGPFTLPWLIMGMAAALHEDEPDDDSSRDAADAVGLYANR